MGMSSEQRALFAQLQQAIANLQNPHTNAAQEFLSNQAIAGANFLQGGEYGKALPKGLFFNFQQPAEQLDQYKKLANVNQGGTFALANNQGQQGARTQATALQGKYLNDRFARDASQNYQNNIADAAGNIRGALGQAAGAQSQNSGAIISALGNAYGLLPQHTSPWGSILGVGGGLLAHI